VSNETPENVDGPTAAYALQAVATMIETLRKNQGYYLSELDSDMLEECAKMLRDFASEMKK
jgi:hypothetical protein